MATGGINNTFDTDLLIDAGLNMYFHCYCCFPIEKGSPRDPN